MDRNNPYEAAFEAYLKHHRLCYVGVDESRRALCGSAPVKNLDFIVLGLAGAKLLIDVKGRQFPGGSEGNPRYIWESWSTQEDIAGLEQWSQLFGPSYTALFVFLYRIGPTVQLQVHPDELWVFRDERYLPRAVTLEDYRTHMKVRSPKWGTVSLGTAVFHQLVRPFRHFSHEKPAVFEEEDDGQDQARRLNQEASFALQAFLDRSGEGWSRSDRN